MGVRRRKTARGERELDLHGLHREEALRRLREALQEARRAGSVRLVVNHGKGTGVLRAMVWEFLDGHPAVAQLYHPLPPRGGEGVTWADLA